MIILLDFRLPTALQLTPLIRDVGVPNVYLPDAIIMFVVIPVVHLMNDEETKQVIYERNWYQGFRHMFGFQNQIEPQNPPGNQNI